MLSEAGQDACQVSNRYQRLKSLGIMSLVRAFTEVRPLPPWSLHSRSLFLDRWCRRQQRIWPSLFGLRVPNVADPRGRPLSKVVKVVSHLDGSCAVAIDSHCVAICDGCGSLVPVDTAVAASPSVDSVAVCRLCKFVTALDPALRRCLGLSCPHAGLRMPKDIAFSIVVEAQGPLYCERENDVGQLTSALRAFVLCGARRHRAAQDLLDLIGSKTHFCASAWRSDRHSFCRELVQEGALLLDHVATACEKGIPGAKPNGANAFDKLALSFVAHVECRDALWIGDACSACAAATKSSRSIIGMIISSAKVVTKARASCALWTGDAIFPSRDSVEESYEALNVIRNAQKDMQTACANVREHLLQCPRCMR
jgi:hypothetical protein